MPPSPPTPLPQAGEGSRLASGLSHIGPRTTSPKPHLFVRTSNLANLFKYRLRFSQYLMIPETQDTIASTFQITFTLLIVFRLLLMLTTVQLDDQPAFGADEVNDIRANGFLPFELQTKEAVSTQAIPETLLGVGHPAPQTLGVVE